MEAIQEPNSQFNFEQLTLSPPVSVSSGNHFIKYSYNGNPLYVQTPKCKMKQGIVKAGKKMYCDLMFSIENEELTQWLENLENNSQKYIYEKREKWFETTLEKHDIENSFTSLVKLIKSGKCYTLRSNVPMILGKPSLKIYNESEELLTLEDLKDDTQVISILEVQGIKCSPRGFQIEIEIKQLLVLNPPDIFQKCILISGNKSKIAAQNEEVNNKSSPPLVDINPVTKLREGVSLAVVDQTPQLLLRKSEEEFGPNLNSKVASLPEKFENESEILDEHTIDGNPDTNLITNNSASKLLQELGDFSKEPAAVGTGFSVASNLRSEEEFEQETGANDGVFGSNNRGRSTELFENITDAFTSPNLSPEAELENQNLTEIEFNLEEIPVEDSLVLKKRNDVYYEMYREALRKAKMAKEMAVSSYLEAKRIKNIYMLEDLSDTESDEEVGDLESP